MESFAQILDRCATETDLVARYSGDEFLVLMPESTMARASKFAEEVSQLIDTEFHGTLYGGVAEAMAEESVDRILSRVDSALYSARASSDGGLYQHTGKSIRPLVLAPSGGMQPLLSR